MIAATLRLSFGLITFTILATTGLAQTDTELNEAIKDLQSSDMDTRRAAIDVVQTSLDPRIPDACLVAIRLEGDSVKRLAARAIGSRWHQIPKERTAEFLAALKPLLSVEDEGLANMAKRGTALLKREYASNAMVCRSPNKRWALYERYGVPCIIDTKNATEELVGFEFEAKMVCSWGNSELTSTVNWHPKKDVVAVEMLDGRRLGPLMIWQPGKEPVRLSVAEFAGALKRDEDSFFFPGGIYADVESWKGDILLFKLSYTTENGTDLVDHEAKLSWNLATGKLAVVADKVLTGN